MWINDYINPEVTSTSLHDEKHVELAIPFMVFDRNFVRTCVLHMARLHITHILCVSE